MSIKNRLLCLPVEIILPLGISYLTIGGYRYADQLSHELKWMNEIRILYIILHV